jgi:ubiquinone/menaquinone biosynthesis C-methylase UbiE
MTKARIVETDHGITGEFNVEMYDRFQRNFRDKGILATDRIIQSGIDHGSAIELGPGPGYLGLEWLKKTNETKLVGVEISPDMIKISERNSRTYGLHERVQYVHAEAEYMPLEEGTFDAVFTNGSLHEWSDPVRVFKEIHRVLAPEGRFFVSDLRRDVPFLSKWFMYSLCKPREIRPGFLTSVRAAYTRDEIRILIRNLGFKEMQVSQSPFGLQITGIK